MASIVFKKSNDSYQGTLSSLKKIESEISPAILSSRNVVIKINFVSTIHKLATTPVDSVRAFLDFTKEIGYEKDIIIAETATLGITKQGFKTFGYYKLEKDYKNVKIFDLKKDSAISVKLIDSQNNEFDVEYSKTIKEADYVVSTCRAKTHDTVGITLSIKNLAVGGIIRRRSKVHQGINIHKNIELLTSFRKPDLSIVDGVVGMQGNGPISGSPINSNWIIVGDDCVAVDSLGMNVMGFELKDVGYLKLCKESSIGVYHNDENVVIKGDPIEDNPKYYSHSNFYNQPKV